LKVVPKSHKILNHKWKRGRYRPTICNFSQALNT